MLEGTTLAEYKTVSFDFVDKAKASCICNMLSLMKDTAKTREKIRHSKDVAMVDGGWYGLKCCCWIKTFDWIPPQNQNCSLKAWLDFLGMVIATS